MQIEYNHDGHEMVVRLMTTDGNPSSAYLVPSRENLHLFKGDIYKTVKQHLDDDDNKPF